LRSAGISLSTFGAIDDDMEEVVAVKARDERVDGRKQESECGLFILHPFLWGVTRDPEYFRNPSPQSRSWPHSRDHVRLILCCLHVT
jgi:hypothetical protein